MNGWISSSSTPLQDGTLTQGTAIRRFCAARMDQERDQGEWDDAFFDIEAWSSSRDSSSPPCSWASFEETSFIDSVINTSLCEQANEDATPVQDLRMYEVAHESLDIVGNSVDYSGVPLVPSGVVDVEARGINEGLELVHLLLACAEAVGCRDARLAASTLHRIWTFANPCGDSLQRVSFCFAMGLQSRLSLLRNIGTNGSLTGAVTTDGPLVTREEKMEGFRLLYQTTPYIAFGFMAANEAICQAARGKDYLHIIDLGMEHTLQWPSLIRTLVSRSEGPPKLLRITGICSAMFSDLPELESSMRAITNEANALGMPVEFRALEEAPSPLLPNLDQLELRQGEVVFVNSIMHLHKYVRESRGSLKAILTAIKKLNPALVTVVEQDANHNGPFFLARFLESLHYYSAIFDSLEASLPRASTQRLKIEKCHFAEEIRNIVAYEGCDRVARHERADQWRRQLGRAGFQVVGLKSTSQARMLLSVYGCEGYTVASEKGCLLLGWNGRPIMWASAWQVNPLSSS
ncbi:GRAS family protein RAD1-like [Phoenix dactylifera]|uniref:GRAS family protein RAD1-like n=1 Tax=Phoenix dactylifera TaxID=42345 RepID=A0A8B7CBP0_PHODC|nr:GRAS family protein RAD1-like [Phoenix dactylifera]